MKKKRRYQVRCWAIHVWAWVPCTKAEPQPSGWLHYELADGTVGLARPGTWRELP